MGLLAIAMLLGSGGARAATVGQDPDLRLVNAAKEYDRTQVRDLLRQKFAVNQSTPDGMTALHWAVYNNDVEMAKMLVEAGANVKAVTRLESLTPLFMACSRGNAAMVELLLKAGSDANFADTLGTTALMEASAAGSVETVKLLLDHGADVNAKETARDQTALMFAADANRAPVIRLLVSRGADLKATSKVTRMAKARLDEDGNPIPAAAESSRTGTGVVTSDVTKAAGAGPATVMGGLTALHYAARDNKKEAVEALVESGADVNEQSMGDKNTPIIIATSNGHFDLAKYLLDHGADPNLKTADGLAPLYAILESQWAPAIATPRPITTQEKTTHLELMKALIDKGADPNGKILRPLWFSPVHANSMWVKPGQTTPFWRAAQATDLPAMKLLVAHGADPKVISAAKDTPLHMAAGVGWAGNFSTNAPDGFMPVVKYLVEEQGADVNAVDAQGYTPLMGAAFRGDNEMVQYLVAKGAKVTPRSNLGWGLADFANGPSLRSSVPLAHPDTVALLIKLGAPPLIKVNDEEILGIIRRKIPEPGAETKTESKTDTKSGTEK